MRAIAHTILFALGALPLLGCAPPYAVWDDRGTGLYVPDRSRPPVNLALGARASENELAQRMTDRTSWPFRLDGYEIDEFETATEYTHDDQRFYDQRWGGGYWRSADSFRTRTRFR